MMRLQLVIGAVAVFAAAGAFGQQSQDDPHKDLFALLDEDRSDGINAQEAQASPTVVQSFSRVDVNSDGILTREEFQAAFPATQPKPETPPRSPPPPK